MPACTFFGHRDCPERIRPKLREAVVEHIERHGVNMFYMGQQGAFDRMARAVLIELRALYPEINYAVVLERLPQKRDHDTRDLSDTMLPEGIESVHPRYAITWRNRWLLSQADFAVTYITHSWGGAAQFADAARKKKKTVIDLADITTA